jgi:hypothetical protein
VKTTQNKATTIATPTNKQPQPTNGKKRLSFISSIFGA